MSHTTFLGDILFRVHPELLVCETRWPDGKKVIAAPQDDAQYAATAQRLGFGADTWALCLSHEWAHTWLAQWQGLRASPTLRGQAEGQPAGADVHGPEERAVLTLQGLLNDADVPAADRQALADLALARLVDQARTALVGLRLGVETA